MQFWTNGRDLQAISAFRREKVYQLNAAFDEWQDLVSDNCIQGAECFALECSFDVSIEFSKI